jgi:hypothetical protein
VKKGPCFGIEESYVFEDLASFPNDMSVGVIVEGCPCPRELNAIQLYIARSYPNLEEFKRLHDIRGLDENNRATRHFLSIHGPILQEIFCGTVCPSGTDCQRGNLYIPQQYA